MFAKHSSWSQNFLQLWRKHFLRVNLKICRSFAVCNDNVLHSKTSALLLWSLLSVRSKVANNQNNRKTFSQGCFWNSKITSLTELFWKSVNEFPRTYSITCLLITEFFSMSCYIFPWKSLSCSPLWDIVQRINLGGNEIMVFHISYWPRNSTLIVPLFLLLNS